LRPLTNTVSVLVAAGGVPPPPPQLLVQAPVCTVIGTDEEVFVEGLLSVVDSPTVAVFVIVWPASPEFTVAAISRLAVELALKSPIVHVPVELAYVPTDAVALSNVSPEGKISVATTSVEVAGPVAVTVSA
jgi:hypothetical protein